jgi:hypothetical protein
MTGFLKTSLSSRLRSKPLNRKWLSPPSNRSDENVCKRRVSPHAEYRLMKSNDPSKA